MSTKTTAGDEKRGLEEAANQRSVGEFGEGTFLSRQRLDISTNYRMKDWYRFVVCGVIVTLVCAVRSAVYFRYYVSFICNIIYNYNMENICFIKLFTKMPIKYFIIS